MKLHTYKRYWVKWDKYHAECAENKTQTCTKTKCGNIIK